MKKPKIKIQKIDRDIWSFLDYGGGDYTLMEQRMVIHFRPAHKDYEVVHAFPFTNEKGIDGAIDELQLAKEAIKLIRKSVTN